MTENKITIKTEVAVKLLSVPKIVSKVLYHLLEVIEDKDNFKINFIEVSKKLDTHVTTIYRAVKYLQNLEILIKINDDYKLNTEKINN